jgi:transposase-like protein
VDPFGQPLVGSELAERGVEADHVTIYRWVQRFTSLLGRGRPALSACRW